MLLGMALKEIGANFGIEEGLEVLSGASVFCQAEPGLAFNKNSAL